ncbi:MAG: DUF4097 domain-containing protein [Armatimonadota bacterium]|nr:DUF4097 domain-containing protein [Armatimonadota bacterium]
MSEESILILNMLREGKITAEQADSLLRAVRETGIPPTPPPSVGAPPPPMPPPPHAPDPAAMASMQAKLAELQGKLGDLQGKLGAAQTAKAAGQAAAFAGKVLDHIPRPDLDLGKINKAVDEAMRGLNSLKNDALRTAKTAARQASHEARRAAREGRKAMKFEFNFDFGGDASHSEQPVNTNGQPEAAETSHDTVAWTGADRLILENKYGSITVIGVESVDGAATAVVTKKAWAGSEAEARVVLQQVFLTNQVENGRCKIGVAAPHDARERLTVDYEIRVPRQTPLEVSTTFGTINAQGVSSALTTKSASGDVSVEQVWAAEGSETRVNSASGGARVTNWNAPTGSLLVETGSADIHAERVTGQTVSLSSRSGDVTAQKVQATGTASFESASGDVHVTDGAGGTRALARTQSGSVAVTNLRADEVHVETISGDAEVRDVAGTLTVKTVSGDIETNEADSPAVSLLTVSGDAHWRCAGPFSGSFAGTTVSGDLLLELPAESNTRIEMNTTSGSLGLSLPLTETALTDKHAEGKLGDGTGSVRLQSVSGDLTVTSGT